MCNCKCCRKPLSGSAAVYRIIAMREELKRKGIIKETNKHDCLSGRYKPKKNGLPVFKSPPPPPPSRIIKEGVDPNKAIKTKPFFGCMDGRYISDIDRDIRKLKIKIIEKLILIVIGLAYLALSGYCVYIYLFCS